MVCDKCHLNEATVVVNHVVNGKATVMHFCEKCAQSQGLLGGKMIFKIPMPNFGLVVPSRFMNQSPIRRSNSLDKEFEQEILKPLLEKSTDGETILEKKISELKKEKNIAVRNEDYTSAAQIRDRIKELEKKLSE